MNEAVAKSWLLEVLEEKEDCSMKTEWQTKGSSESAKGRVTQTDVDNLAREKGLVGLNPLR